MPEKSEYELININELTSNIKKLKTDIKEEMEAKDYEGEFDLLLCVIENLENEINKTKNPKNIDKHTYARILADTTLMQVLLDTEDDYEDEDFFDYFDDDEDLEDVEEEEK